MKNILIFLCLLISFQVNSFSQWVKCCSYNTIHCISAKDNLLLAGGENGLYLSTNDGDNWKEIKKDSIHYYSIHSIASKGNNIFVGSMEYGIYRTSDFGESWINLNDDLSDSSVYAIIFFNDNLFLGTIRSGIYKSSDFGQSWKSINNGIDDFPEIKYFAIKNDKILVGTNTSGIYLSLNEGENWEQINNGLSNKCIHNIIFNDNNLFIGNHRGVSISTNYGNNWYEVNNGFNIFPGSYFIVWALTSYKNYIFAGTEVNGIFISSNNGQNWFPINNDLTEFEVLSLVIKEPYIFAGTNFGIFRANINELLKTLDVNSDNVSVNDLNISPNPASSSINVVYNMQSLGTAQITITNSFGQQVYNANVNNDDASNEQRHSIDISTFPSGLYFVTLRSPAMALTKGVVVLK